MGTIVIIFVVLVCARVLVHVKVELILLLGKNAVARDLHNETKNSSLSLGAMKLHDPR